MKDEKRMPGFTAEASLESTRASYQLTNTHASPEMKGLIQAQFWIRHGNFVCDEWGNCIYVGRVLF